jgi:hypothetical protein
VRVSLLARDLIISSRIAEAAARAGAELRRCDDPAELPAAAEIDMLLVDWADRRSDWGERLVAWSALARCSARPRVVLFGPHTDLAAHAEARAAGLGPMWARSKLIADLSTLLGKARP